MNEASKNSPQKSTLLRALSLDLVQGSAYLNPFKRVLKTASTSKDRYELDLATDLKIFSTPDITEQTH